MAWLEGSALGHVMRDSGVWFYGIINLTHILGVATLFGSVVILAGFSAVYFRREALSARSPTMWMVSST